MSVVVVVVEGNAVLLVLEHLMLLLLLLQPLAYPFYGCTFPCATSLSKHIQIWMDFLQTQTQVQTLHFIVHYNYHFVLFFFFWIYMNKSLRSSDQQDHECFALPCINSHYVVYTSSMCSLLTTCSCRENWFWCEANVYAFMHSWASHFIIKTSVTYISSAHPPHQPQCCYKLCNGLYAYHWGVNRLQLALYYAQFINIAEIHYNITCTYYCSQPFPSGEQHPGCHNSAVKSLNKHGYVRITPLGRGNYEATCTVYNSWRNRMRGS